MKQTKHKIRKLNRILKRVKKHFDLMRALTDEELQAKTGEFKARLKKGESLDSLLPEAFAAICEADYRVLGMFPFDVQILGGIALHRGYLAQMNTGEGKTLTATMPLYLNALTEKSTILVTHNGYLAQRDAEEMGPVYRFMGLSVACGVKEDDGERFSNEEKKEIYASDIVYTTHGILGFDYLLDNLVSSAEKRYLREYYYVIIDEADSVLLDSASTPLVIAGVPRVQSNLYYTADMFVRSLSEDRDYVKEDGNVWLTEQGIERTEKYFRIPNLYGHEYFEINRHVNLALKAQQLFEADRDYMVDDKGELKLLDGGTGRLMDGVKLRGGQHQAIEQKEGAKLSQESRSMACITYQNLFLLFPKMSGMSGTIADSKAELSSVYGVETVIIPPNRKLRRVDLPDRYFHTSEEQLDAVAEDVQHEHRNERPVLVVASNIFETEALSQRLMKLHVPHNVLNAGNAHWEADMIREAGHRGAVTVATSMAGRGTDIKLESGVAELGGLFVMGIGRLANRRLEQQAKGRAGRQGDPGESRFYISADDDIAVKSLGEKKQEKLHKASLKKVRKLVNSAQSLTNEKGAQSRKQAFEYDLVLQRQRTIIYCMRDSLLDGEDISDDKIIESAGKTIDTFFRKNKKPDLNEINRFILDTISYKQPSKSEQLKDFRKKRIKKYLLELVKDRLKVRETEIGDGDSFNNFKRIAILKAIDDAWVEQVDYLQELQKAVTARGTAQRNPVFEYQVEALASYRKMEERIFRDVIRYILLSSVSVDKDGEFDIIYP